MINHLIEGIVSGLLGLVLLYAGYVLRYVGEHLVVGCGNETSSSGGGMPKWKAAVVAPFVAVVLGMAASKCIGWMEGPEAFGSVFVFSCGAMWVGIARVAAPRPGPATQDGLG